jgi:hypothetical protein
MDGWNDRLIMMMMMMCGSGGGWVCTQSVCVGWVWGVCHRDGGSPEPETVMLVDTSTSTKFLAIP